MCQSNVAFSDVPSNLHGHARHIAERFWVAVLMLACIAPIVGIATIIWQYGVDIPYWDEWTIGNFLTAARLRGYPLWSELIAQHNEHRIFFPRLIFLYMGELTYWNLRVGMFFNFGLMVLGDWGLYVLLRRRLSLRGTLLTLIAVNLVIFSPAHYDNWLLGIQLLFFIPINALIWGLVYLDRSDRFWGRFTLACVLCVVTSFSFGNGMELWALLLPSMLWCAAGVHGRRWRATLIWLILAAGTFALYVHGYHKPPQDPPIVFFWQNPLEFTLYFLKFFGNGLHINDSLIGMTAIGSASLIATFIVCMCLISRWRDITLWKMCLPWLILIAYSLISAGLVTTGRLSLGDPLPAPRYSLLAVPLFIGLFGLIAIILQQTTLSIGSLPFLYFLLGGGAGVLSIGLIYAWIAGIDSCNYIYEIRLPSRACVQFYDVAPEIQLLNERITPYQPPQLTEEIHALYREGLLSCGLIESSDISKIAGRYQRFNHGVFENLQINGSTVTVSGWGRISAKQLPAAILLTAPDSSGKERIFAVVGRMWNFRPDVANSLGISALSNSGWSQSFDASRFPSGAIISAWAYDTYAKKAYRLLGTHQFPSHQSNGH